MGLKFKIISGYGILIALLAVTIYLFRSEQIKRNTLLRNEKEPVATWQLTERIYADLLELATEGEMVSVWEQGDYLSYRKKRTDICDTLQILKNNAHTLGLRDRIDSLCFLLKDKELLLGAVMNTFKRLQSQADIVNKRIPTIISKVERLPDATKEEAVQEEPKRRKNIFSIFRKKEKKSAYLQHKESMEKPQEKNSSSVTTGMLYSLNREVSKERQAQQILLANQMDSLCIKNIILNQKLNSLIRTLEFESNRKISDRYRQFVSEREQSYLLISFLAISVSLLAILLYIIIHRELNRKYRYEKELEASDRRNRELLRSRKDMMLSIAHDLRSPLSTIKGAAELLPEESVPERRSEYMESISHASDYMLTLVETLMSFYLLDTDQVQAHVSFFHLESLFREIADGCLLQARKKELRFSCDLSGMDMVVRGDKGRLQQIVNNLLSNALKFTDRGSIRLKAEYRSGELSFSVQDTGCGMNREETERIFTAFERLENARDIPGFGLGLTISYRLVALMRGTIRVESRPGEGSTFIVTLPLTMADGKLQTEKEDSETSVRLDGVSALLLDDDIRQLHITREMLKRSGACCDICTNSRELISRMRENSYDVLLTDIQMPEMDGFAILELLRASNIGQAKTIPAIALTARVDEERHYLSRGFAGCIRKPFTKESLTNGIAEVIGPRDRREWEPDFSLLFAGEENRKEMLEIFISESKKELSLLHEAWLGHDRQGIHAILHKNLPLWETVRLDYPMEKLREIVMQDPGNWTEKQLEEIPKIKHAAERLVAYAEKIREGNR